MNVNESLYTKEYLKTAEYPTKSKTTTEKKKTTSTQTKPTEENKALTSQLALQLMGNHFGPQPAENYTKRTNIVTAGNGVFRVEKTPVALYKTQIAEMGKEQSIPGLPNMEEGVELLIPKIPFKYWLQILSWYRDVNEKDKTEASVLFFWNHNDVPIPEKYTDGSLIKGLTEDGKLIVYCPEQTNSSALSEFGDDLMVKWLRENTAMLCETHSHNSMAAFFSKTDDQNENYTQFYAVYGKVDEEDIDFAFRFTSGGKQVQCNPDLLFDYPKVKYTTTIKKEFLNHEEIEGFEMSEHSEEEFERYTGPWPQVEYPSDWMPQHSKSYYKTTIGKTQYSNYYAGYGGYGAYDLDDEWAAYENYYGVGQTDRKNYKDWANTKTDSKNKSHSEQSSVKKNEEEGEIVIENGNTEITILTDYLLTKANEKEVITLVEELCYFGYIDIIQQVVEETKYYFE